MFTTQYETLNRHVSSAGALERGTSIHGGAWSETKALVNYPFHFLKAESKRRCFHLSGTDTTVYGVAFQVGNSASTIWSPWFRVVVVSSTVRKGGLS